MRAVGPASIALVEEGHHVWCPSVVCWDGRWWLFHSRWPIRLGFDAWVSHSIIAVAVGDRPEGPFTEAVDVLPGAGAGWDAHVTHNPMVLVHGGRLWLFYMGNHGSAPRDGVADKAQWWEHRNNQRIGVAWAEHPLGPWHRRDTPLVDIADAPFPILMASNPAVANDPSGGVRMIWKCVADGAWPFGGEVRHLVSEAPAPDGPFVTRPEPVLTRPGVRFAAEDPFLWHDHAGWQMLCKDMGGHFTGAGTSIARFVSADGRTWNPAPVALVADLQVSDGQGHRRTVKRLERPCRSPDGRWLLAACLDGEVSSVVAMALSA